jgi:hypothetical protein
MTLMALARFTEDIKSMASMLLVTYTLYDLVVSHERNTWSLRFWPSILPTINECAEAHSSITELS